MMMRQDLSRLLRPKPLVEGSMTKLQRRAPVDLIRFHTTNILESL